MAKIIPVSEIPEKPKKLPPPPPKPTPNDFHAFRSAELNIQLDLMEKRRELREKMRASREAK
jgi:hypothetical protein